MQSLVNDASKIFSRRSSRNSTSMSNQAKSVSCPDHGLESWDLDVNENYECIEGISQGFTCEKP